VSIGEKGQFALQMADDNTSDSLFVKARESNEAFADLYTSYHPAVVRYFERRTPNTDVAIDLTADNFGALFASIAGFHGTNEDQGRAWMWTIARNTLYAWYRRRSVEHRFCERVGVEPPIPGTDDYERVEELADCKEARLTMQRAFELLSPTDRTALTLHVIDELSYGQIAAKLGVSVAAARVRAWRARCKLLEIVHSVDVTDARTNPYTLAPAIRALTP
jgi:RNA polymerase sigma factor (sigma-70 family)